MSDQLPAELEARLRVLEDPENQGADFDRASWVWLLLLGIALPIAVFIWGTS